MKFIAPFLFALLLLSCAKRLTAEPDNPLLGRWLVQRTGMRDATKLPFQIEWEFTKDKVIVRGIKSEEISRNSYTLDLTKNPKWITVSIVDQAIEIRPGIFRIVGDELHLKQTVGGGSRPTHFVEGAYSILKRQTSKKDRQ